MKKYVVPTVEIYALPQEDVIRTSGDVSDEAGWTDYH